jgi:hypothetical protein
MSKQDGYSSRTAADLERKYNFGKTFAEVYDLVSDAQRAAQEASNAVDNLTHDEVFNLLTDFGESQGVYRDDATGNVYINASYIKTGKMSADLLEAKSFKSNATTIINDVVTTGFIEALEIEVNAAQINGTLSAKNIDVMELNTYGLTAQVLRGAAVGLNSVDSGKESKAGNLKITGSSSASYAVELNSGGALRLTADEGDIYIEDGSGAALTFNDGRIATNCAFYPNEDATHNLGRESYRWGDVWASNATIQTSDRNEKHDIKYGMERFDAFFDGLMPVTFKLNDGISNRDHSGLIAQDVEDNLIACGMTGTDFAGLVKFQKEDGSFGYGLRYGEFIGLLIDQVQKLKARVAELEEKTA